MPDSKAVKSTAIITTIIGCFSSLGAILGNTLVLFVLIKFDRLHTPSNTLIGSLCVSDLLTGFIVTPFSAARRLQEAHRIRPCVLRLVCAFFAFLCLATSIVTVGGISIDRYFAVVMPFRYRRNATIFRYLIIIAISWTSLGLITLFPFIAVIDTKTFFQVLFGLMGVSIVVFLITYAKISRIVRSHRRKICSVRHASYVSNDSTASERVLAIRESKKANTIAIVIGCGLCSYMPLAVMFILRGTIGDTVELVTIADPWADLFLQVTSAINPIIYCMRSSDIRDHISRALPDRLERLFLRIFRKR